MSYSAKVIDHFEHPRNVGSLPKDDPDVGTGLVGAPECGDVMKLQLRINPQTGVIDDVKFKTFGCGSAIASSSLITEWLKGRTIDEALAIKNSDIIDELELPPVKLHCSVLAEDGIRAAIADVETKEGFSLKDVSLGVWAGYAEGGLTVSFLQAGDDGLPKAIKKTGNGNGHASANGATGNGDSEYVLADGRVFATCLDAVHAMGIETHGADGKVLSGKAYYHRHDRLPKEVKDAIAKQAKATEEAAADGDANS